ncbi:hypothetical protein [Methyloferula stellata]|uniref:hypothetical protein n=1 Tax=Methyloferula stellata TaxID=876270 RepID=UPI00037E05A5|nr:hypothetical protein [Methyloferula stellata]
MKILRHIIVPAGFFCLAASLSTMPVMAQERVGDGALGALAGAVVLGPIGLLAGGVIGYTAGPGIADSWGTRYHRHHYRRAHYHRPRQ